MSSHCSHLSVLDFAHFKLIECSISSMNGGNGGKEGIMMMTFFPVFFFFFFPSPNYPLMRDKTRKMDSRYAWGAFRNGEIILFPSLPLFGWE